jgi:15-cis-phytoene synthase
MDALYNQVCIKTSEYTTKRYSTSFSLGTRFLAKRFRNPIYAVYGFVRFADEIVDTFHEYDRATLLADFRTDVRKAIDQRISLNPILHSFQDTYHRFGLTWDMVDTFLLSMEMDLNDVRYTRETYDQYILGSAEVVGLMCLRVFTEGDDALYQRLKPHAMKLGAAFQKINFLRDLHDDNVELGRMYFPGLDLRQFDADAKRRIEREIEADFHEGFLGIKELPKDSRFGVYVAYRYYSRLLQDIRKMPPSTIMHQRVRIPDIRKYGLFMTSYMRHSLNLL